MGRLADRIRVDEQMDDPALAPATYDKVLKDLARVNAVAGSLELARAAAEEAVLLAHSSEQLSERAAAEDLRDALAHSIVEPPESVAYASDVPG
jgi:hypothetical protein